MATYQELYILHNDVTLIQKVAMAIAIAIEIIRNEDANLITHEARLIWAALALKNVDGMARNMIWILLAQYKTATVQQITEATDSMIQNAVLDAIDVFT